jgi:hypothetical protein
MSHKFQRLVLFVLLLVMPVLAQLASQSAAQVEARVNGKGFAMHLDLLRKRLLSVGVGG